MQLEVGSWQLAVGSWRLAVSGCVKYTTTTFVLYEMLTHIKKTMCIAATFPLKKNPCP